MFETDKNFEIIGTEVYHKLTNKLIVDLGKNGAALETPMCLLVRTSDQSKNYDMAFDCDGNLLKGTGENDCVGVFPCDKKYQILHHSGRVTNYFFPLIKTSFFHIRHDGQKYVFSTKTDREFASGTNYHIYTIDSREYLAVCQENTQQDEKGVNLSDCKRWTLFSSDGVVVPEVSNARSIRLADNHFFVENENHDVKEVPVLTYEKESFGAKRWGCLFAGVVTCVSWIAIAQLSRCFVEDVSVKQEIPTCSGLSIDNENEMKSILPPRKITSGNVISQSDKQHVKQ